MSLLIRYLCLLRTPGVFRAIKSPVTWSRKLGYSVKEGSYIKGRFRVVSSLIQSFFSLLLLPSEKTHSENIMKIYFG